MLYQALHFSHHLHQLSLRSDGLDLGHPSLPTRGFNPSPPPLPTHGFNTPLFLSMGSTPSLPTHGFNTPPLPTQHPSLPTHGFRQSEQAAMVLVLHGIWIFIWSNIISVVESGIKAYVKLFSSKQSFRYRAIRNIQGVRYRYTDFIFFNWTNTYIIFSYFSDKECIKGRKKILKFIFVGIHYFTFHYN